MLVGAHVVIYSTDADVDRAFLRDVLKLPSVDAGGGWLIFSLPPSEVAVHPATAGDRHELYFNRSRGEVFFALDRGEAIGTAAAIRVADTVFELAKMAVRPSHQGRAASGYAIGVGTFVPNNAVIIHEDAVTLMAKMMKERGIAHTTSECTLRGFTCSQVKVDPKVASPAEIARMRAMAIGHQMDRLTGGLVVK